MISNSLKVIEIDPEEWGEEELEALARRSRTEEEFLKYDVEWRMRDQHPAYSPQRKRIGAGRYRR